MPGLRVYRALSLVFPHSFRAKVVGVVLACTVLPMLAFVCWLMAHNGLDPANMIAAAALALLATISGTVLALVLIYKLLAPLRMVADVIEAYYREHRLPDLPDDGRDEIGALMRAVNCGLVQIDQGLREMERLSLEDPLTHALNRRGSERFLFDCVARAEREHLPMALYVVDLDNLKPVNDQYGHAAGDRMLVRLVEGARRWLGPELHIGRWGGDEFLLCLHQPQALANARVQGWLDDLAATRHGDVPIRASVGCAEHRPGLDAMQLYREADAAMYRAKANGGGQVRGCDGCEELPDPQALRG